MCGTFCKCLTEDEASIHDSHFSRYQAELFRSSIQICVLLAELFNELLDGLDQKLGLIKALVLFPKSDPVLELVFIVGRVWLLLEANHYY